MNIHAIATKVMKCDAESLEHPYGLYRTHDGVWRYIGRAWNPYESGTDCFMVIDRMEEKARAVDDGYSGAHLNIGWYACDSTYCANFGTLPSTEARDKNLRTAICEATLKELESEE